MADLSIHYMGLRLRNPLIAASSGLTHSLENIRELEKNGIGAIVLKSLFEEQIRFEISKSVDHERGVNGLYPEAFDYIGNYAKEKYIDQYLSLIRQAKQAVSVPIIASINCMSADEWTGFAKKVEEAGADGLELNVFILPADPAFGGEQNEKIYFDILEAVLKQVSIPVALKISYYFSGLSKTALKLSWAGAKALVLFNRFYSPDINLDSMKVVPSNVFSSPDELNHSLRWVAMLSDRLHCDIAASTGIHDGKAMVKQLLAGAKAVQVATTLYKNGFGRVNEMINFLDFWMNKHNYQEIKQFNGLLSFKKTDNPASWERVQFMKHFAGIE